MPDLLDLTARQVRHPGGTVHKLTQAAAGHGGRVYGTRCRTTLHAASGAILTTRETTCGPCITGKGSAAAPGSPETGGAW